MPDMNNFFNELIQNDYFEKQASENESIKNALEDCSSSVLQKLAQELGALSEEKATTLQEKLAAEEETEETEETDEKETNTEEKDGECKAEDSETEEPDEEGEKEDEKEAECEPEKEDETEPAKEDEKEAECDTEAEDEEEQEETKDDEKEAFEREAYFAAQEKLASHNLSIADFVFEKCANEDVAEYIAETAEKLACLCDKSALQIADEIFDSVMNKLG